MDAKTAFLNGDLDEKIYMEQPKGFVVLNQKKKVCKLAKSLYGLKQEVKQWHEKLDKVMLSNGFKINECDKYVYIKVANRWYVIVCLYVDVVLIVGSNDKMIKTIKKMLNKHYDHNKEPSILCNEWQRLPFLYKLVFFAPLYTQQQLRAHKVLESFFFPYLLFSQ